MKYYFLDEIFLDEREYHLHVLNEEGTMVLSTIFATYDPKSLLALLKNKNCFPLRLKHLLKMAQQKHIYQLNKDNIKNVLNSLL